MLKHMFGGQRTTLWTQFSPSTVQVPGIELGSSGLVASLDTLSHLALIFNYLLNFNSSC